MNTSYARKRKVCWTDDHSETQRKPAKHLKLTKDI